MLLSFCSYPQDSLSSIKGNQLTLEQLEIYSAPSTVIELKEIEILAYKEPEIYTYHTCCRTIIPIHPSKKLIISQSTPKTRKKCILRRKL